MNGLPYGPKTNRDCAYSKMQFGLPWSMEGGIRWLFEPYWSPIYIHWTPHLPMTLRECIICFLDAC